MGRRRLLIAFQIGGPPPPMAVFSACPSSLAPSIVRAGKNELYCAFPGLPYCQFAHRSRRGNTPRCMTVEVLLDDGHPIQF